MTRLILIYGLIAGLIVAIPMFLTMISWGDNEPYSGGAVIGYLTMLVALTAVFLGVKQYRDKMKGGVVKFLPALGVGLAISAVASIVYVLGWELSLAVTGFDFMDKMMEVEIAKQQASGASQAEIDKFVASMAWMQQNYSNPLYRMPITFVEMFPVGVLVSLVSAGLLRNSRLLPARAVA